MFKISIKWDSIDYHLPIVQAQNRDRIFDNEESLFEFIIKIKDNYFKIRN